MEGLLVIVFLATCIWYLWGRRHWCVSRAHHALLAISDFTPTFCFVGVNCVTMAMDATTRKIAFVDGVGHVKVYDHREIVTAEICRNIVSFSKTNRLNQFFSATVWDRLFGPKGFRVGGMTASTTTSERVSALSLKVCMKDIAYPVKEIFFYRGSAISVGSAKYHSCITGADEWQARLRLVASGFSAEPREPGKDAPSRLVSRLRRRTE